MAQPGALQNDDPITAAAPRAWTLREIIQAIAGAHHRSPAFIGVPWRTLWGALKVGEWLRLPLPFRSDSVVSLVAQNPRPSFESLHRIGISFREFTASALAAPAS
jgi:hypothetical protein